MVMLNNTGILWSQWCHQNTCYFKLSECHQFFPFCGNLKGTYKAPFDHVLTKEQHILSSLTLLALIVHSICLNYSAVPTCWSTQLSNYYHLLQSYHDAIPVVLLEIQMKKQKSLTWGRNSFLTQFGQSTGLLLGTMTSVLRGAGPHSSNVTLDCEPIYECWGSESEGAFRIASSAKSSKAIPSPVNCNPHPSRTTPQDPVHKYHKWHWREGTSLALANAQWKRPQLTAENPNATLSKMTEIRWP